MLHIDGSSSLDVEHFYLSELLPEKLNVELRYVSEWTLLGDFRILAHTFVSLLSSARW